MGQKPLFPPPPPSAFYCCEVYSPFTKRTSGKIIFTRFCAEEVVVRGYMGLLCMSVCAKKDARACRCVRVCACAQRCNLMGTMRHERRAERENKHKMGRPRFSFICFSFSFSFFFASRFASAKKKEKKRKDKKSTCPSFLPLLRNEEDEGVCAGARMQMCTDNGGGGGRKLSGVTIFGWRLRRPFFPFPGGGGKWVGERKMERQ